MTTGTTAIAGSTGRATTRSARWLTLDVFRGIAILSMIQGHTFTVLLRPADYGESWLPWYTLLHGLTAPMFLVGGGLAYGLLSLRDSADARWGTPSPRIARRALTLLALGYMLQLPKVPIGELWLRPELLAGAARVGPLQLVGACLLIVELLRSCTRERRGFMRALTLLCLTVCAVAPFVWQARASGWLWVPVGTWLDGYAGSLFPFFPWSVFFFGGVLASGLTRRARAQMNQRHERLTALKVVLAGFAVAATAYLMFLHGFVLRGLYGQYELWHTSPLYVAFRAALAAGLLGALWLLEPALHTVWRRAAWVDRIFGTLSRQSLVAYVTHLLILYGTPLTVGLVRLGTTLNLVEASVSFAFVLGLTTAISILWDHFVTSGLVPSKLARMLRVLVVGPARQVDRVGEG